VLYPGPGRRGTVRGARPLLRLLTMGSGTHILPGSERGAQAGIEPATGAWVTQQIGSATSGTDHVHTPASLDANVTPRFSQVVISDGGRARPKGTGLVSASVWTLNVPVWRSRG